MKFTSASLACLAFLLLDCAWASLLSGRSDLVHRHAALAARSPVRRSTLTRRATRCPASSSSVSTSSLVTSTASGLINSTWTCNGKPSGATTQVMPTGGPNGQQSWLNCGINGNGWTPPPVKIGQLVTVDLRTNLQSSSSPFHACAKYVDFFEKYAGKYGFPPIVLASFSMQESGCNPATVGGAGEVGLMQITPAKCVGAPGGNCFDPEFNIATAAKYFSETLAEDDGNILYTVGRYNGWPMGLTYAKATAAAHTSCCRCQNNLDYLQQWANGWILGLNPYKLKLGSVFNLAVCPKDEAD